MALADLKTRAVAYYGSLNARERKLVLFMGAVATVLVVFLPFFMLTSAISDIEDENQKIGEVLRDISRARETLAKRESEREAAEARYNQKAPALGSFIEARAGEQSLTLREVNDQPEKVVGIFTRREVRATIPSVAIQPAIKLLAAIDASRLPIAINRLQLESRRQNNEYNLVVGVLTFDGVQTKSAKNEGEASPGGGPDGRSRRPRTRGPAGIGDAPGGSRPREPGARRPGSPPLQPSTPPMPVPPGGAERSTR